MVELAATFDIATAGFTAIVGLTSAANYWLQGRGRLGILVAVATAVRVERGELVEIPDAFEKCRERREQQRHERRSREVR